MAHQTSAYLASKTVIEVGHVDGVFGVDWVALNDPANWETTRIGWFPKIAAIDAVKTLADEAERAYAEYQAWQGFLAQCAEDAEALDAIYSEQLFSRGA